MAIKISGTTVIDDSRNISNILEINETAVNVGTGTSINLNNGTLFYATPDGNKTYTFDNPSTTCTFTLRVIPSTTVTLTWPAAVDWAGGSAPDAPASGETDFLVFTTLDGGTTWYGFLAGDAMS